jgi:hypothetical protein
MQITRILLTICAILAAGIALTVPYINEDLFLSFAAGRDIAQGLVAAPDHWSFTAEDKVWVNQAWLSHLILYLSYSEFGPAGPVAVKVLLLAGCAALVFLRSIHLGASANISLVALLMGALASAPFLGLRPENFGVFFFILFTFLLMDPKNTGITRRVGAPLALVVWSNCHGSFALGLGLVVANAIVVTFRMVFGFTWGAPRPSSTGDVVESWILALASLLGVAALNPYGLDNLLMPFRQVGTSVVTAHSADWLPLLSFHLSQRAGFAAVGGYAYVAFLGLFLIALALLASLRLIGDKDEKVGREPFQSDIFMEILVVGATATLAFRFGRLGLFAGFALTPLASLVFQRLKDDFSRKYSGHYREGFVKIVAGASAVALTAGMGWLFYRCGVVPYWPGNPVRPPRPLARELMSFDVYSPHVSQFLKKNRLLDRVFPGWELSPFLMSELPEVRLFMDCRDQSFYPAEVMKDYFTILGVIPQQRSQAQSLLDKYGVSTVVLATTPIDFDLAAPLMASRKWACVYADAWALVLVRADSDTFRNMADSDFKRVWFPDGDTEVLSRSILSLYLNGRISDDLVEALKLMVLSDPRPNSYGFICLGMDNAASCFKPETVRYLVSEAVRLSRIHPHEANKGGQVLESLVRIYEILEENAMKCGNPVMAAKSRSLKETYQAAYQELRNTYTGSFY